MKNRTINGILLLNKPKGMTSNGALQRVKRLFGAKKAGHTGSLDPLATGMLPICFGEATKFSQYLLESNKYYQVTVKLGIKTTTGDAEGAVMTTRSVAGVTEAKIAAVLPQFMGTIQQIPPMFSAIKHEGTPLYQLARQGIEIERAPRTVNIYDLQLQNFSGELFDLYVHCSKGTYVRTLAEDIGEALGCGAYVYALHRLSVAPYENSAMYDLSMLEQIQQQQSQAVLPEYLLPVETSVKHFPAVKLSASAAFYLRTGQPVKVSNVFMDGLVQLFSEEEKFLGMGEMLEDGRVTPRRMVAQQVKMERAVGA